MRKIIVGAVLALAAIGSSFTPASAETVTAAAACDDNMKEQRNDGIATVVWFKTEGSGCKVERIATYQRPVRKYGHFHVFGPNGYSRNSPTRWWERLEEYNEYPNAWTSAGQLWCSQFFDGNNNPVTTPVCITVD